MNKIFYLTNDLKSGAIPHAIIDIASSLPDEFEVLVGGLLTGSDARISPQIVEELKAAGATLQRFEFDTQPNHQAAKHLYDVLQNVDILHTHLIRSGVIGRILATLEGNTKIISTEQSVHTSNQYNLKQRVTNSATLPLADYVVAVSSTVEESFNNWIRSTVPPERRRVIHNPIDPEVISAQRGSGLSEDTESFVSHSRPLIGSVGRLEPVKNHQLLLDAIEPLTEEYPDLGVVLVGDGPLERKLRRKAEKKGLNDSVFFTGRISREKVYSLLYKLNVFAMPSLHEGSPIALCEAMCSGTPIVGSDIKVFREILGKTAHLAELSADEWTEALQRGIAEGQSDATKRRAKQKFSSEQIASEYEDVYRDLL